jgi:hypothetical protein
MASKRKIPEDDSTEAIVSQDSSQSKRTFLILYLSVEDCEKKGVVFIGDKGKPLDILNLLSEMDTDSYCIHPEIVVLEENAADTLDIYFAIEGDYDSSNATIYITKICNSTDDDDEDNYEDPDEVANVYMRNYFIETREKNRSFFRPREFYSDIEDEGIADEEPMDTLCKITLSEAEEKIPDPKNNPEDFNYWAQDNDLHAMYITDVSRNKLNLPFIAAITGTRNDKAKFKEILEKYKLMEYADDLSSTILW